jgi:hypothetical protein
MLGNRLFNSGAPAMNLLMGGYDWQRAVMLMREILEPTFLLDFFVKTARRAAMPDKCTNIDQEKQISAAC